MRDIGVVLWLIDFIVNELINMQLITTELIVIDQI